MTDLLHRNNRFVTVHNERSKNPHRQPVSATLQFVYEDRMLLVWVDIQDYLCSQQHPKCSNFSRASFFFKLNSSSNPTNKNVTELGVEMQTVLSR